MDLVRLSGFLGRDGRQASKMRLKGGRAATCLYLRKGRGRKTLSTYAERTNLKGSGKKSDATGKAMVKGFSKINKHLKAFNGGGSDRGDCQGEKHRNQAAKRKSWLCQKGLLKRENPKRDEGAWW